MTDPAWRVELTRTRSGTCAASTRRSAAASKPRSPPSPRTRTGPGALRKLTNAPEHRLRVGDWRAPILLDPETRTITVTRVLPRGRAYRD